jgi:nucleoside permease NupC
LGLCMQMIFGLLVFKTGAGLAVITWLALAASDLLESGIQGTFKESITTSCY